MRHLFAVPRLTRIGRTLLGIGVVVILMFGVFALLEVPNGERQAPSKELITGSIPGAAPVRQPPPNDPMAAFLSPASTQLTTHPMRSTVVERRAVPLPRPRPKRLWSSCKIARRPADSQAICFAFLGPCFKKFCASV